MEGLGLPFFMHHAKPFGDFSQATNSLFELLDGINNNSQATKHFKGDTKHV